MQSKILGNVGFYIMLWGKYTKMHYRVDSAFNYTLSSIENCALKLKSYNSPVILEVHVT